MKKLVIVMIALAGILAGCGGSDDMSSPPASAPATNSAAK